MFGFEEMFRGEKFTSYKSHIQFKKKGMKRKMKKIKKET
jgi:hypothetical protein